MRSRAVSGGVCDVISAASTPRAPRLVFPVRSARPAQRKLARRTLPRAGNGDGKDNVDWDGAWTDFQKQQRTTSRGNGNKGVRRPPTRPPRQKVSSPLDEIKRAEAGVLSPWSSEQFAQIGIAAAVVLLIVMVAVGGSEIHDSRCTLPWC